MVTSMTVGTCWWCTLAWLKCLHRRLHLQYSTVPIASSLGLISSRASSLVIPLLYYIRFLDYRHFFFSFSLVAKSLSYCHTSFTPLALLARLEIT